MSRLIDKAELFNALSTEQTDDYQYKSKVYSIIGEMKAVDAAQVVRCRECLHWKESIVVDRHCDVFDWFSSEDDYCSFAERRTK